MRISGGIARGITLQTPKGDRTRPATDGMRQSVFSSLAMRVPGARFADLFAGSGGYGLEAFSRGAAGGVFVEKNNRACACIARNIEAVMRSVARGAEGQKPNAASAALRICAMDALAWSPAPGETPDLVFVDPPYEIIADIAPPLFERLSGFDGLSEGDPVVVFEMPGELELNPPGWTCVKRLGGKGAHQPSVCFFRRQSAIT